MDESRGGRLLRPVRPLRRHGLLTWAALATALLMNTLARRLEWAAAAIAVLGAIVTSPILYYIFVVPYMAHALVFAAAAALIWRLVRAHERPAAGSWLLVGAIAGLLFLVRWQAAVGLALVLSVGVTDVCRRRIAMVSLVVFARDWGRWGSGAGDRRAHPVRERLGHEWVGNDAFGGRRFDVVVPFAALGLASLIERHRRAPLVLPALYLLAAAFWNTGLIRLYRLRIITEAALFERVATAQARQFRREAEDMGAAIAKNRGRPMVATTAHGPSTDGPSSHALASSSLWKAPCRTCERP